MTDREPRITGLLESALYVSDVKSSMSFYETILGFRPLVVEENFAALAVAEKQVLLIFKHGAGAGMTTSGGGTIPAHDGSGRLHVAFSIDAENLDAWEKRLRQHGLKIESTVRWPRGGTSLYVRDPDGHLVELATPGIWEVY